MLRICAQCGLLMSPTRTQTRRRQGSSLGMVHESHRLKGPPECSLQSFSERSRNLLAEAEGLFEEVIANAPYRKTEQQKAGLQTGQKRDRSSIISKTVSPVFPCTS